MASEIEGGVAVSTGWDEKAAEEALHIASMTDELELPWTIAASLVHHDRADIETVLDIASGPGGFLSTVLAEFPSAKGIWFDFSQTMLTEATEKLNALAPRLEFRVGDMLDLSTAAAPQSVDFVVSSRATHHVKAEDLAGFYGQVNSVMRPGGWLANLDILGAPEPWSSRITDVRRALRPKDMPPPQAANHPHLFPRPLLEDHFSGLREAGFEQIRIVWTSFWSNLSLLMAQKPE